MILWVQLDATGLLRRWSSSPAAGWTRIETNLDPMTIYVRDGEVLPLPPSPGDWAVFDPASGTWSDPSQPAPADDPAIGGPDNDAN